MDPIAVLRALWNHRLVASVVLLMTAIAGAYVFFFTPSTFESTATYALLNPQIPTAAEIEKNPSLGELNSDNPYLRSSDSSLAVQVLITQLNSDATVLQLEAMGLETDYLAAPGSSGGQGLLVTLTSYGPTPASSIATTTGLGDLLTEKLRSVQKVNGADDRYLFTALEVESPDTAKEQVSSRLRALLVVGIAGFVLLFAAVSVSRAIDTARSKKRESRTHDAEPAREGPAEWPRTPPAVTRQGRVRAPAPKEPGSRPAARGSARR